MMRLIILFIQDETMPCPLLGTKLKTRKNKRLDRRVEDQGGIALGQKVIRLDFLMSKACVSLKMIVRRNHE